MTDKMRCFIGGERVEVKSTTANVNSSTTMRVCREHALMLVDEWLKLPVSQQAGVSITLQIVDERS